MPKGAPGWRVDTSSTRGGTLGTLRATCGCDAWYIVGFDGGAGSPTTPRGAVSCELAPDGLIAAVELAGDVSDVASTGGGIVAHADDWTYTLVIPLTHPMASSSAKGSYRFVHNELVDALNEMGTTAELQPCAQTATHTKKAFVKTENVTKDRSLRSPVKHHRQAIRESR